MFVQFILRIKNDTIFSPRFSLYLVYSDLLHTFISLPGAIHSGGKVMARDYHPIIEL
jgi:hypothetical protein